MLYEIFRFIPIIELDPANPGGYAHVMYDTVSQIVLVLDDDGNNVRPKRNAFDDEGAQLICAGYYFTKLSYYPFAERNGLVPPPEPEEPTVVLGCTDPAATNYNPNATSDNGTCEYSPATFLCQTVEVRPCEPKGVFLRWKNRLGGIDGWLFTGQVDTPNVAEALGEYTRYSGLQGASLKTADRGMVVRTSGLSLNRFEALCEIFTSPLVWIHYEDAATEEVYCKPASASYSKNQKELEVEISRVPFNTLTR